MISRANAETIYMKQRDDITGYNKCLCYLSWTDCSPPSCIYLLLNRFFPNLTHNACLLSPSLLYLWNSMMSSPAATSVYVHPVILLLIHHPSPNCLIPAVPVPQLYNHSIFFPFFPISSRNARMLSPSLLLDFIFLLSIAYCSNPFPQ